MYLKQCLGSLFLFIDKAAANPPDGAIENGQGCEIVPERTVLVKNTTLFAKFLGSTVVKTSISVLSSLVSGKKSNRAVRLVEDALTLFLAYFCTFIRRTNTLFIYCKFIEQINCSYIVNLLNKYIVHIL